MTEAPRVQLATCSELELHLAELAAKKTISCYKKRKCAVMRVRKTSAMKEECDWKTNAGRPIWPFRIASDKRLSGTKSTQKEDLCLFEKVCGEA